MCGITGFIDNSKSSNVTILRRMTMSLKHRGPNFQDQVFKQSEQTQVGLGHTRLSILDLSKSGNQPMNFENLTIIYNGEIYNFHELRSELIKSGYKFNSNSDTEVILKLFHKFGLDSFKKLIGMFSIVITNWNDGKTYFVRDRFGVKPLYIFKYDDIVVFGSEIKALKKHPKFIREIDYEAASLYFRYGYIVGEKSIFKNTSKAKPGTVTILNHNNLSYNVINFWEDNYHLNKTENITYQDAEDKLENLLEESFLYRKISDVPYGIFLSGGYDSSCVAALLQKNSMEKIKTFTIGFNNETFNEAPIAKKTAEILGTDHFEYYIDEKEALEVVPNLTNIYDEPFGDSSAIPTYLISSYAKKKVDVILSADGSDEMFAGYNKHHRALKQYYQFNSLGLNILKKFNPNFSFLKDLNVKTPNFKNKISKLNSFLSDSSIENIFDLQSIYFYPNEINRLLDYKPLRVESNFFNSKSDNFKSLLDYILYVDYKTYLVDDILVKVDRASMSVSLESREPFLNHSILDFLSRLPQNIKYKSNSPKHFIKNIVHKYLPESHISRPKTGFSVPLNDWFENGLNEFFMDNLSANTILNQDEIQSIINRYNKGEKHLVKQLWFIVIFNDWYLKNF
jgi:asparagine synthase (glutamine-hydrolysing)